MITLFEARQIVGRMKDQFDSHDFILLYACAFPLSYLKCLWRYEGNAKIADSQIAKTISRMSSRLDISKGEKAFSKNIKGNITECTVWTKK